MTNSNLFFLVIVFLSLIVLGIKLILSSYPEKKTLESGFRSFLGINKTQFSTLLRLFSLLFLLSGLELFLVYPYIVSVYANGVYGLIIMLIFFFILTLGLMLMLSEIAFKIKSFSIKQIVNSLKEKVFNRNFFFSVFAVFLLGLSLRIGITAIYNINVFTSYADPLSIGYYLLMAFITVFVKQVINRKDVAFFLAFFVFSSVSILYCIYIYDIHSFILFFKELLYDIIFIASLCVLQIPLGEFSIHIAHSDIAGGSSSSSLPGGQQMVPYKGPGEKDILNPKPAIPSSYIGPGGNNVLNPSSSPPVVPPSRPTLTAAVQPVATNQTTGNATYFQLTVPVPSDYNMPPLYIPPFIPRSASDGVCKYDVSSLRSVVNYLELARSSYIIREPGLEPTVHQLTRGHPNERHMKGILKDYILNVNTKPLARDTLSSPTGRYKVLWSKVEYTDIRPIFVSR